MDSERVHPHHTDLMSKGSRKRKALRHDIAPKAVPTDAVMERLPSWFCSDWLWVLILVLAVIVTYSPVWWAGYIWDDGAMFSANPVIIGPLGLKEIWTTSAA